MGRSVLAVLAGAVVWAVLWVGGTSQVPRIFPDVDPTEPIGSVGILTGLVAFSVALSILAGWTTGRVAAAGAVKHATVLAVIQLAIGIFVQASAWELFPVWYHLVFLGLIVPATVYGGRLAARPAR